MTSRDCDGLGKITVRSILRKFWKKTIPQEKIDFFIFLYAKIDGRLKKILNPEVMSDFVRTFFKMFLVVELTKLGGHNFYLGLHSIYFKF